MLFISSGQLAALLIVVLLAASLPSLAAALTEASTIAGSGATMLAYDAGSDTLWVSSHDGTLKVYSAQATTRGTSAELASYPLLAHSIAFFGSQAFVAAGPLGVIVLNVTSAGNATTLSRFMYGGFPACRVTLSIDTFGSNSTLKNVLVLSYDGQTNCPITDVNGSTEVAADWSPILLTFSASTAAVAVSKPFPAGQLVTHLARQTSRLVYATPTTVGSIPDWVSNDEFQLQPCGGEKIADAKDDLTSSLVGACTDGSIVTVDLENTITDTATLALSGGSPAALCLVPNRGILFLLTGAGRLYAVDYNNSTTPSVVGEMLLGDDGCNECVVAGSSVHIRCRHSIHNVVAPSVFNGSMPNLVVATARFGRRGTARAITASPTQLFFSESGTLQKFTPNETAFVPTREYTLDFVPTNLAYDSVFGALYGATVSDIYRIALSSGTFAVATSVLSAQAICAMAVERGVVAAAIGTTITNCTTVQLRNASGDTIGHASWLRDIRKLEIHSGRVLALANDTLMIFSLPQSGVEALTLEFTYDAPAPVTTFFSLRREDRTLDSVYVSTRLGVDVLYPTVQAESMTLHFSHRWSDSYWRAVAPNGVAVNSGAGHVLLAGPAGTTARLRIVDLRRNIVVAGSQPGFNLPSVDLLASPPPVLLHTGSTFVGLMSTPLPLSTTVLAYYRALPVLTVATGRDWGCTSHTQRLDLGGFESYDGECDNELAACLHQMEDSATCLRNRFQCVLRSSALQVSINETRSAVEVNPSLLENSTALYRSCAQFVCEVGASLEADASVCPFVVETTMNATLQFTSSSARRRINQDTLRAFQLELQAALGFPIVRDLLLLHCESTGICVYSFAVGGVSSRNQQLHDRTNQALSSLRATNSGYRLLSLFLGNSIGKHSTPPTASPRTAKQTSIVLLAVFVAVGGALLLGFIVWAVLQVAAKSSTPKSISSKADTFYKSTDMSLSEILTGMELLQTRSWSPKTRRDASLRAAVLAIRTVANEMEGGSSSKEHRDAQRLEWSRLISRVRDTSGDLDNGTEFALDVAEELLYVTGLELPPQVREPVVAAVSAVTAAQNGDVTSLRCLAECTGTSDGVVNGWLCEVLYLWRIDGASQSADVAALLRAQLRRKPMDDWHVLYQWLLVVDDALDVENAEIRELALQLLRVSGLVDHPHWRVREKLADTVARIASRTGSDGHGYEVTAAELCTVLGSAEVDERVLVPLSEPDVEQRLQRLVEKHREQVDAALQRHVQRALAEADSSATELARSAVAVDVEPEGQAILARGQHNLERSERISRSLRGTFRTGGAPVLEHSCGSDPETLPAAASEGGSEYSGEDVAALKTRLEASAVWEGSTAELANEVPLVPRLRRVWGEIQRKAKEHPDVLSRFPMLRALLRDLRDPLEATLQTPTTAMCVLIHSDLLNTLLSVKELLATAASGRKLALRLLDHHTLMLRLRLSVCFQRLRLQIGVPALPALIQAPLAMEMPSDLCLDGLRIRDILDSTDNAKVLKVNWQGAPVAVKLLNNDGNGRALLEAAVQGRLCHPHIAALYGCVEQPRPQAGPMLVLELVDRTLADAISNTDAPFALHDKARISLQLALAMQYLHGLEADPVSHSPRMLLHGDLKPGNVLLDNDLNVKLIDFGHAAWRATTHSNTSPLNAESLSERGTAGYQSPEGFRGEPVTTRSDVFSFGTVLYEIWTRKQAFSTGAAIDSAMRQGNMPSVDGVDNVRVQNLILRCWNEDPTKRPSFTLIALELLRVTT